MGIGDKETAASVGAELRHFAKSQEKFNEIVTKAIERMGETSTKNEVLKVEHENLKAYVSDIHQEQRKQATKIDDLRETVKVNTVLSNQVQKLKYIFIAAFLSAGLAVGGYAMRDSAPTENQALEQIVQLLEAQQKENAHEDKWKKLGWIHRRLTTSWYKPWLDYYWRVARSVKNYRGRPSAAN